MSNYIVNNDIVDVLSENCITILKNLPAKVYTINVSLQGQISLKEHNFIFNSKKIYGDLNKKVQRIFKTYESRDKNLGVLLSGLKGTGKSLLIKLCIERAIEDNIPVILVNQKINLNKFSDFIKKIDEKVVCVFDEFDKFSYEDTDTCGEDSGKESQFGLLGLLDGINENKNLYLFSCNNLYKINQFFLSRPGRIFYHFKFDSLSSEVIQEYLKDNLKVQIDTNISQFIKTSKSILNFSFDVLQALTEECNLYETTLDKIINDINIEFRPCDYKIKVLPQAGNKFEYITKTDISPEPINLFTTNPLRIAKRLKGSNDDYEWKHIVFGPNDLIENGTDRLVYKIEKENILLECTQAISIDYNIADIFNMNNNYRNAF